MIIAKIIKAGMRIGTRVKLANRKLMFGELGSLTGKRIFPSISKVPMKAAVKIPTKSMITSFGREVLAGMTAAEALNYMSKKLNISEGVNKVTNEIQNQAMEMASNKGKQTAEYVNEKATTLREALSHRWQVRKEAKAHANSERALRDLEIIEYNREALEKQPSLAMKKKKKKN